MSIRVTGKIIIPVEWEWDEETFEDVHADAYCFSEDIVSDAKSKILKQVTEVINPDLIGPLQFEVLSTTTDEESRLYKATLTPLPQKPK